MIEEWRTIPEFENYQISNFGQVRRVWRTKTSHVKVVRDNNYIYCNLSYAPYKSKQVDVRRLLDQCFDVHCFSSEDDTADLEGEEWRDIAGWEFYEVSSLGRVRTKEHLREGKNETQTMCKSRIKKAYLDDDGYERISLYEGARTKLVGVHRLVASAFIPNPNSLPQVNHKNANKSDNRAANLEWVSNLVNIRHSIKVGVRDPHTFAKPVIRVSDQKIYSSVAELHREIGDSYYSYNRILYYLTNSQDGTLIKGSVYKFL